MLKNSRGQLAGYEAIIIIVLLGTTGLALWLWAKKPSQNAIYQNGSKPQITDFHCSPFSCCARGPEEMRQKHESIVNKVKH